MESTNNVDKAYLSVGVGEDAYFRRRNAIGVADGVGGWSRVKGANPALYSRKLMHYACQEVGKADDDEVSVVDWLDPKAVLQRSYDQVCLDVEKEVRSRNGKADSIDFGWKYDCMHHDFV